MKSADDRLLRLLYERAYREGDITLSSGKHASYYIDAKEVVFHPEGSMLVGDQICDLLKDYPHQVDAIGGLMVGAAPMATAVALVSHLRRDMKDIPAFVVRKEPKKHGLRKLIEGSLQEGMRVVIVDDVITTGGSVLQAIDCVRDMGCTVDLVIALLDREQEGRENIEGAGCEFRALYTITELRQLAGPQPGQAEADETRGGNPNSELSLAASGGR
jgi:orotate phosphoribosyltransferase